MRMNMILQLKHNNFNHDKQISYEVAKLCVGVNLPRALVMISVLQEVHVHLHLPSINQGIDRLLKQWILQIDAKELDSTNIVYVQSKELNRNITTSDTDDMLNMQSVMKATTGLNSVQMAELNDALNWRFV